jgi:hypothetical protein
MQDNKIGGDFVMSNVELSDTKNFKNKKCVPSSLSNILASKKISKTQSMTASLCIRTWSDPVCQDHGGQDGQDGRGQLQYR